MKRIKLPADWTEDTCNQYLKKIIDQGMKEVESHKYDDAAKYFINAARLVREIPAIKRKEVNNARNNKYIKNRKDKYKNSPQITPKEQPPKPTTPFNTDSVE